MLTKEECEEALSSIEFTLHQRVKPKKLGHCEDDNLNILWKLINEHFKDKKSLEELFKDMKSLEEDLFNDYKGETSKEDPWGDLYEGIKERIEEQARKEVKDVD